MKQLVKWQVGATFWQLALFILGWLGASRTVDAQIVPGSYPASVSASIAPADALPGKSARIHVNVTLDPGFHTYDIVQPEMKEVATQLSLSVPAPLQTVGDWTGTPPEEKVENQKTIFVHNEGPSWEIDLKIPGETLPGAYTITGKIRLVVCSDSGCLPPRTEEFSLTLNIAGGSSAGPAPAAIGTDSGPNTTRSVAPVSDGNDSEIALPDFTLIHTDLVIENLWVALGAGLLAGLILNVMPCVLPVISLKIYGYVKQAGSDRRRIQAMGLSFCAGIMSVFLVFGVLFAYAGQTWGALFQSDTFNVIMVAILVACALWMFEVFIFTMPGIVSEADAAAAARKDLVGEFAKGALATLLSTPCSGPLLIPVISFALKSQSPPVIFATLSAIGLGMALPYLLLAWKPGWMKIMPKPGDWMRTFKEFMGFLLLGTAIWLLWQRRRNGELVVWTVAFSTFVGLAGWLYGRWSDPMKSAAKRFAAPVLAILLIAAGAFFSFGVMYEPPVSAADQVAGRQTQSAAHSVENTNEQDYHWRPFDLKTFLAAQSKGQTVVVDWTADW